MTPRDWKRTIAALALGGATVALGGSAAGAVWAQQGSEATPNSSAQQTPGQQAPGPNRPDPAARQQRHQQFLAAVAAKLNVSAEQLQQAMDQARQELGQPQRGQGRFGPGFGGPRHGGPGFFGPGGQRGPGPGGFERRGGFGGGLVAAAQAMNLSVDQLRQELPGKSLADVARAHSVDPSTVANALKAQAGTRLDQAVTAGRLTADQAAQMKQRQSERIDQLMNQPAPTGAPRQDGGPRRGAGPAPSNAPSSGAPLQPPPSI
jgi:transposase-like protein